MSGDELVRLGKYELISRLARGGMAEILLARQPGFRDFSRLVVIKRLLPQLADRPQVLEMFVEEAGLASQINHRNVVRIYDVGEDDETYYIAMEYIDGLSVAWLTRRARHKGVLPPFDVSAELIAQACDGLHAAHELRDENGEHQELVHRDISPQNLMIDRSGTLKLLDFGIAKARGSAVQTRTGSVKGKFPYMSPEQCLGESLDRRSDLFALGSVFIELLTGQRPFERSSELETIKAITTEPIPSASDLNPDVPKALVHVVDKAHARERDARYETAAEMGNELRLAMEELAFKTSPKTLAEYLETDCADLLVARSDEISRLCAEVFSATGPTLIRDLRRSQTSEAPTELDTPTVETPLTPREPQSRSHRVPSSRALVIATALLLFAGLAAIVIWYVATAHRPASPPLRLACPPFYDQEEVEEGLHPLAQYLGRRIGRRVEVKVADTYARVVDGLIDGTYEIASLSPLPYIQARDREPRIQLLAAKTYEGAHTYQSYLVTSTTSSVKTIDDLEAKRFCYVDESSTSGYLLPRHYLRTKGFDPDRLFSKAVFSGTHVKVMEDVIAGRCDAGAIFSGAFISANDLDIPSSKLRLLAIAGETSRGVIVATPDLDQKLRDDVTQALLDFSPKRDLGRSTLSDRFPIDGFEAADIEDYEMLEAAARREGLLDLPP